MNETGFLSKVSIFSHMKEEDLRRIARHAQYHEFRKGEVIIREGEQDNRLFIVVSGEVEAIKNLGARDERVLRALGPYCYFGEMALIDDLTRSVSVVAREDTQVLSLEQWDLRQEIKKSPAMAIELLQTLSRRLRANEKIIGKVLGTLLPICANCKKVRDEEGSWTPLEYYISEHSEAEFSHGICPECARRLYPQFYKDE